MRARRRIRDGVVHQVHHHLHHQARIHVDERRLIARHHPKLVLAHGRVHVAQRLLHNIVHQLQRRRQMHAAALELGNGKQVFHRSVEPQRVRANGLEHIAARLVVEHGGAGRTLIEQHVSIARDARERRAQIV